jgi:hypothetical protein
VFQLVQGDYEHTERTLRQDDVLWGFVDDKIGFVDFTVDTAKTIANRICC